MTQEELAEKLGYKSRSSVNKIEKGERDIPRSQIKRIAEILEVSPLSLLGFEEELTKTEQDKDLPIAEKSLTTKREYLGFNILDKKNIYMIPIFSSASAGFGAYADSKIIGYEPIYLSKPSEAEKTIAVVVKGDSMFPKIEEDDLVIVHKQDYFENGDIVVAVVCGEDNGFVKRAFQSKDKLTLESINPVYPPMVFSGTKLDEIKIMGVVKKIIKSV